MRPRFRSRRVTLIALAIGACTPVVIAPTPPVPSLSIDDVPRVVDVERIVDVEHIVDVAREIVAFGPREATSDAYDAAARVVDRALTAFGYRVVLHRFMAPAGVSWGIEVPAGMASNVMADLPGFDASKPHLIVGAHLDTVPQAPGANDNASGVAIMIELARLASLEQTHLPIRFVAFGAEEPRAPGDDGHHYGSRSYVEKTMTAADRRALAGMLSLDRVGIGDGIRVCTGGEDGRALADRFLRRADALGIPAVHCENRTSDHWSFERNGMPGVRLLGDEHPTYHTARDRMNVLERAQLERMATLAWQTLRRLR